MKKITNIIKIIPFLIILMLFFVGCGNKKTSDQQIAAQKVDSPKEIQILYLEKGQKLITHTSVNKMEYENIMTRPMREDEFPECYTITSIGEQYNENKTIKTKYIGEKRVKFCEIKN